MHLFKARNMQHICRH